MNLAQLNQFIDELNELLETSVSDFSNTRLSSNLFDNDITEVASEGDYQGNQLSETEIKVYIKISLYFRLLTLTVTNLTVAYEIWLKGILQILLDEVVLTFESWDRICSIGDHTKALQERIDTEWTKFLDELRQGNLNADVWDLIQKGKARSDELMKQKIIRKKRPM